VNSARAIASYVSPFCRVVKELRGKLDFARSSNATLRSNSE
jgi:hypothetical protein